MRTMKLRCTCPAKRFLATIDVGCRYFEANCSSCGHVVIRIVQADGSENIRRFRPPAVVR